MEYTQLPNCRAYGVRVQIWAIFEDPPLHFLPLSAPNFPILTAARPKLDSSAAKILHEDSNFRLILRWEAKRPSYFRL